MDTKLLFKPFVVASADDLFANVLKTSVMVPQTLDPRWLKGNISLIDREIKATQKYMLEGGHFEVEKVNETAPQKILRLQIARKDFEMALMGYFPIDMSFLSGTRADGLPQLITQHWHSTEDFRLTVMPANHISQDDFYLGPYLHPLLAAQYYPAIENMLQIAKDERLSELSISAHFSGSIPVWANQLMMKAESTKKFYEYVLVAEGPESYDFQKTVYIEPVIDVDPLAIAITDVLGVMRCYLIAAFGLTSLESNVVAQFTNSPGR